MSLNEKQNLRYSRNILINEIGRQGQEKILNARILIIGAGGLGSAAALYLAAAGVGTIGIADSDIVDLSNLQRQIIHFTTDLAKSKVKSAIEKIEKLNPDVKVKTYNQRLKADNITKIIKDYDFIIDATDNFSSKFLINDACVLNSKSYSHAGVLRFDGQTFTYVPGTGCYRCIFSQMPAKGTIPTSSEVGILGSIAGMTGTIQATEAIKYILSKGELLTNRLLIFNALNMNFREVKFKKNPKCPICGENPSISELTDNKY